MMILLSAVKHPCGVKPEMPNHRRQTVSASLRRWRLTPVGQKQMIKIMNLIIAAFCFYLFSTGIAYCRINKWITGVSCLLMALIGIISIYILDKRREQKDEIKQDEINTHRIVKIKEEFCKSEYYELNIKVGFNKLIISKNGIIPPNMNFVAWNDVRKISVFKAGGDSKSEPTPYYVLSIFLATNELITTKFKRASEHAKVAEAISQWLWKRQTQETRKDEGLLLA